MNCETACLWIQGSLDGELNRWREWCLRRHLAQCDDCLRTMAESSRAHHAVSAARDDVVRALDAGADQDYFWLQVRRRLDSSESRASRHWAPAWSLAGATVVAVLLVSLITVWQSDRPLAEPRIMTEISNIETPLTNTSHLTFISAESGTTFIIISGLPTEFEEEEGEEL